VNFLVFLRHVAATSTPSTVFSRFCGVISFLCLFHNYKEKGSRGHEGEIVFRGGVTSKIVFLLSVQFDPKFI